MMSSFCKTDCKTVRSTFAKNPMLFSKLPPPPSPWNKTQRKKRGRQKACIAVSQLSMLTLAMQFLKHKLIFLPYHFSCKDLPAIPFLVQRPPRHTISRAKTSPPYRFACKALSYHAIHHAHRGLSATAASQAGKALPLCFHVSICSRSSSRLWSRR